MARRAKRKRDSRNDPKIRNSRMSVAGGARAPMQCAPLPLYLSRFGLGADESVHRWLSSLQLQGYVVPVELPIEFALCLEFSYSGYRVTLLIFGRLLVSGVLISTIVIDHSGRLV